MTFKEALESLGKGSRDRKEKYHELEEDDSLNNILQERKKSSNQRLLERYMKEEREKEIKKQLDFIEKKRQHEIDYGHNPLMAKNITNKSPYNLLKQKNLFNSKKNLFSNQQFIHKDNKKLLNNGKLHLCH